MEGVRGNEREIQDTQVKENKENGQEHDARDFFSFFLR